MAVEFTGLTSHIANLPEGETAYRGAPCLYHAHSGEDGDAFSWRSKISHACIECTDRIKKDPLGFNLDRLAERNKQRAINFWKRVSIEDLDQCWRWTAPSVNSRVNYTWPRPKLHNTWRYHPIRVAMWLTYGDIGRMGSHSLCGNRRCCNPLHHLPSDLFNRDDKISYDLDFLRSDLQILKDQMIESESSKQEEVLANINQETGFIPSKYKQSVEENNVSTGITLYDQEYLKALRSYEHLYPYLVQIGPSKWARE